MFSLVISRMIGEGYSSLDAVGYEVGGGKIGIERSLNFTLESPSRLRMAIPRPTPSSQSVQQPTIRRKTPLLPPIPRIPLPQNPGPRSLLQQSLWPPIRPPRSLPPQPPTPATASPATAPPFG